MIYTIFFVGIIGIVIGALAYIRKRQYKYNPKQNYQYDLKEGIHFDLSNGIDLSSYTLNSTLVLSLALKSNLFGHFFQPYIEILGNNCEKVYFEHGLQGERYLDLSGFTGVLNVQLRFHHCESIKTSAVLYTFENPDIKDKKVLVLASHADDAEIAAYGLYSSVKQSYIVTITAGEGNCGYCGIIENKREEAIQKGRLRVHDALTVPGLGNVPQKQCVMLGYFCKTLKWMKNHQDGNAFSDSTDIKDINFFRRVDHAVFKCNDNPAATWGSLVEDLRSILESVKPDFVVTPHPEIDSHSDHQYTTYALLEAMEIEKCEQLPILTYTNHHVYNDAYPYGTIFSTSALAPKFKKPFLCSGIYSHRLSLEKQYDKFYALEAMHDLRNSLLVIGVMRAWKHFVKKLRREVQQRDKSYYRRAVRPNELFYVTGWESLSRRSKSSRIERGENGAIEES